MVRALFYVGKSPIPNTDRRWRKKCGKKWLSCCHSSTNPISLSLKKKNQIKQSNLNKKWLMSSRWRKSSLKLRMKRPYLRLLQITLNLTFLIRISSIFCFLFFLSPQTSLASLNSQRACGPNLTQKQLATKRNQHEITQGLVSSDLALSSQTMGFL